VVVADAAAGDAQTDVTGWGEDWDTSWDGGAPAAEETGGDTVSATDSGSDDGGAWSYNPDYTGASIGGDGDFFYFTDGDVSYTIG
jgi:hypothetical protein